MSHSPAHPLKSALRRPLRPQSSEGLNVAHGGIVGTSAFDELQQQHRQSSVDSTSSSLASTPLSSPQLSPPGPMPLQSGATSPTPSSSSSAPHHHHPPTRNTSVVSSASTSSTFSVASSVASSTAGTVKDGYLRRVAFDTMPDASSTSSHNFSFTLQVKSKGYRRTRNTRTFMCAVDGNSYSTHALEWLLDNLVEDGDEVVALRVLDAAHSASLDSSSDDSGDEEEDEKKLEEYREEANELLKSIEDLNDETGDRRISIVVEFVSADPRRRTVTSSITSTVVRLIHMYRPDSITIGTRDKNTTLMQKMMMGAGFSNSVIVGSVSREILSHSPVPVIVVRPENKVEKHLKKRQNDPKRRSYHSLMANALAGLGGHKSDSSTLGVPNKAGAISNTSPLSASFVPGADVSRSPSSASAQSAASASSASTASSSSSSSHPAETSPKTSPAPSPSTAQAIPTTSNEQETPAASTQASSPPTAAEIAKRKPSLRVFAREQHPAGAESESLFSPNASTPATSSFPFAAAFKSGEDKKPNSQGIVASPESTTPSSPNLGPSAER
ncbi:hypothetical protein V8E36_001284 [Tilletia maclaganii]